MSSSPGDLPLWLLDRAPRIVAEGSDAGVVLRLTAPPAISTIEVSRDILTSVGSDHCRVMGADAAGRLLLRFTARPASTGQGEGDSTSSSSSGSGSIGHGLAVCVPLLPTRDAVVAIAEKVSLLPDFPSQIVHDNISPAAPAGILAYQGNASDSAYSVVMLQRSPPSSSVALCYSSDYHAWSEVPVLTSDHRWAQFDADSVLTHERRGDLGGCVVFVDSARGLLVYDPRHPASSSFVGFPELPEGGEMEHAYIHSSDGALVCVATYFLHDEVQGGTMVSIWRLGEEEDQWRLEVPLNFMFPMGLDELIKCDLRVPYPVRETAITVHPDRLTSLFVSVLGDSAWNLSIDLHPTGLPFKRARRDKILPFTASEIPAHLVCRVRTSQEERSGWDWDSAISVMKESRNHLHKLPGAIETAGRLLNIPVEPVVRVVKTINAINDGYNAVNEAYELWETAQATLLNAGQQARIEYVGTVEEAKRVIEQWKLSGKPSGVRVEAVSGMSSEVRIAIRNQFIQERAEALIPRPTTIDESAYVFVERVVPFWAD